MPIHESDGAEERWKEAEWRNFELWEKIELKFKKKRRLWILATVIVFVLISSVPVLMDRWPKWKSLRASRELAGVLNQLKIDAVLKRSAFRISFLGGGSLDYKIEQLSGCTSGAQVLSSDEGSLVSWLGKGAEDFTVLSPGKGHTLGIPGLIESFCYDPLYGGEADKKIQGIGIVPTQDVFVNKLTELRLDRLSIVFVEGTSSQVAFK